jgi:predicted  nucleic acid-binding Zn-ribbon protein
MKTIKLALAASITVALFSVGVVSAGNGSTPNGKPFVAINGEIIEVKGAISSIQDQINELVLRADTAEAQMANFQEAINTLIQQDADLKTLINQNTTDIATLNTIITDLEAQNVALKTQIANSKSDVTDLQSQVASNESMIKSIQDAINSGLLATTISIADLQKQIDNNKAMIAGIQDRMDQLSALVATKQAIINGYCPSGYSIRQILPNGAVACEFDDGVPRNGTINSFRTYQVGTHGQYGDNSGYAPCPWGTTMTGGGYSQSADYLVMNNEPTSSGWYVRSVVQTGYYSPLIIHAVCIYMAS